MTTIVWLRRDLRLADNPALHEAARQGRVLPVYILDDGNAAGRRMGAAGRWWLHHSLVSLRNRLGTLVLLRGDPLDRLSGLAEKIGAGRVYWNRCYELHAISRDRAVMAGLKARGLAVQSFNGSLLNEPWEVASGSGEPYKVFTPYWRACLKRPQLSPSPAPKLMSVPATESEEHLEDWGLLPSAPNWAAGWESLWEPGEIGAQARLDAFLARTIHGYRELRDRPDLPNVSRLSPHLHWGEISPRQVAAMSRHAMAAGEVRPGDIEKFLSELGWREFAHYLLFHFPDLPERNWRPAFDAYPWQSEAGHLEAWQRGRTGYPMVDAGMRELWATGYMHNRVRMVAASFLVKHLRIDWRQGEHWFWDTLVDADLANNVAGWQWVAGSGADASPYFRIFNPVEQGRRFDPTGAYVRRWCPELARLPDAFVHAPFAAPAEILAASGVVLGGTYPAPIVDHATARAAALTGYEAVKRAGTIAARNPE